MSAAVRASRNGRMPEHPTAAWPSRRRGSGAARPAPRSGCRCRSCPAGDGRRAARRHPARRSTARSPWRPLPAERMGEHRRPTDRRPGAADLRGEAQRGFVEEDETGSAPVGVCLIAGHHSLIHRSMAAWSRSAARRTGRCTLQPSRWRRSAPTTFGSCRAGGRDCSLMVARQGRGRLGAVRHQPPVPHGTALLPATAFNYWCWAASRGRGEDRGLGPSGGGGRPARRRG